MSGVIWRPDQSRHVLRLGIGHSAVVEHDGIAGMLVGSCVGLFLFDPVRRLVAAAHVSLPSRTIAAATTPDALLTGKFGDSAPAHLLELIERAGGRRSRTIAKMAGAACMFGGRNLTDNGSSRDSIGDLNADAVRRSVEQLGLRLSSDACGGNQGRKLFFDTRDGILRVVTVRGEMLEL